MMHICVFWTIWGAKCSRGSHAATSTSDPGAALSLLQMIRAETFEKAAQIVEKNCSIEKESILGETGQWFVIYFSTGKSKIFTMWFSCWLIMIIDTQTVLSRCSLSIWIFTPQAPPFFPPSKKKTPTKNLSQIVQKKQWTTVMCASLDQIWFEVQWDAVCRAVISRELCFCSGSLLGSWDLNLYNLSDCR